MANRFSQYRAQLVDCRQQAASSGCEPLLVEGDFAG